MEIKEMNREKRTVITKPLPLLKLHQGLCLSVAELSAEPPLGFGGRAPSSSASCGHLQFHLQQLGGSIPPRPTGNRLIHTFSLSHKRSDFKGHRTFSSAGPRRACHLLACLTLGKPHPVAPQDLLCPSSLDQAERNEAPCVQTRFHQALRNSDSFLSFLRVLLVKPLPL